MNKLFVIIVVLGAFLIGIFIGTVSHKQTKVLSDSVIDVSQTPALDTSDCSQQQDDTDYMRCLLVKAEQETNYRKQRFSSIKHSQILKERLARKQGSSKLRAQIKFVRSILHAGKPLDAIALIEQELATDKYSENLRNQLRSLLAISYLRLGEQTNCLRQDNPKTCIFPLSRDAIYAWKEGSQKAIQIYKDMLKKNPDDLNARWLLNLASMTIDEPLQNIPESWRINSDYLGSDNEMEQFENVAQKINLDIIGLAGSPVVEDLNGDGFLDVLVTSWDIGDQIRLFINNGDHHFLEKTKDANLLGITGGLNMVQADYNNDGCIDILVLRGAWLKSEGEHPNSLLKNECNGTFTDVTRESGILSFFPTQTAAWADYDLDGHLDLFIGNEKYPSELYHNNGDGTFSNVSRETGVTINGFVKGADWGDINNDKLPDLYVSVHGSQNLLYQNKGKDSQGQWQFEEVSKELQVTQPIHSFPTAFFDYNNDGWLDIIALSYSRYERTALYKEMFHQELLDSDPSSVLYKNNGDGTFSNVSKELNINKSVSAMGFNHGDIDNDGYQDVYIGTGSPDFRSVIPNFMFRNGAGKEFINVTAAGGFGHIQKGHGIAFADFDNDGDQDVYAVMGGAFSGDFFQNALYRNPGSENHWVQINLVGNAGNKSAIGARIKVTVESKGQERDIYVETGSGGSFGANPLRNEIGLGDASSINSIEITWPSSSENQVFHNVALDQRYTIIEGRPEMQLLSAPSSR